MMAPEALQWSMLKRPLFSCFAGDGAADSPGQSTWAGKAPEGATGVSDPFSPVAATKAPNYSPPHPTRIHLAPTARHLGGTGNA